MKRTLWTLSLLAAFVIAVSGGATYAMPSLGGPTGIVSTPNALVAPRDTLQTALTYQQQEFAAGMYGGADVNQWQLNVLGGVSDEAELWAAYALADQETPTESKNATMWALGGKYQLTSEPEDQASLAIGASYEAWSDSALAGAVSMYGGFEDLNVMKLYVVATKDFTPETGSSWEWGDGGTRMLGSLGLMYMKVDPDTGSSESLTKPFLGLEFVGAGGTSFGLEYRWKDDDIDTDAVFSAALRHVFSPQVEGEIGVTNAGPSGIGLDDQNFFIRFGYNFPMGGK